MKSIERRLGNLECAAGARELPACVVILDSPDEPAEKAIARHRAQNPDTPEEAKFILFVSGFSSAATWPAHLTLGQ